MNRLNRIKLGVAAVAFMAALSAHASPSLGWVYCYKSPDINVSTHPDFSGISDPEGDGPAGLALTDTAGSYYCVSPETPNSALGVSPYCACKMKTTIINKSFIGRDMMGQALPYTIITQISAVSACFKACPEKVTFTVYAK